MQELLRASALQQADAVRSGAVRAVELVEASLREAERVQRELGAFTVVDGERAMAAAAAIKPGDPRPFAGVPYAPKDLALAVAGLPLTNGSALYGDFRPCYDSVAMARMRAAGVVVIGQTRSPEMGMLPVTEPVRYGPVRNPFDRERTAGGSSGGAGAAVAGGAIAIASASDAGGSTRVPAACCGLVGLKPSLGRITLGPDMADHPFAVEGCLSRDIADTAAFLDVVAGPSAGDAVFHAVPGAPFVDQLADRPRRTIGLCTEPQFDGPLDGERVTAVRAVAVQLAAHGHHIEEIVTNPWPGEPIADSFLDVFAVGIAVFAAIGEMITGQRAGPDNLEPLTWAMVERGRALSAVQLAMAHAALHRWSVAVDTAIARYDAVLTPTIPCPPLPIGSIAEKGADIAAGMGLALRFVAFTPVANITGRPALAMPAGFDRAGLPLSVQLIGRHADESTLLSLGAEFEDIEYPTKEAAV
jgi:amidase